MGLNLRHGCLVVHRLPRCVFEPHPDQGQSPVSGSDSLWMYFGVAVDQFIGSDLFLIFHAIHESPLPILAPHVLADVGVSHTAVLTNLPSYVATQACHRRVQKLLPFLFFA